MVKLSWKENDERQEKSPQVHTTVRAKATRARAGHPYHTASTVVSVGLMPILELHNNWQEFCCKAWMGQAT